jgi:arsenate reductase
MITIYHNPACGTSRNTLALIRNSGEQPQVIEYPKTPPSRETLQRLVADRPIVVTPLGTRQCLTSERVLDVLPRPQQTASNFGR